MPSAVDSLYRISRLVFDANDPDEALRVILDVIMDALKASSASIALIDPDSGCLQIEAFKGLPADSRGLQLRMGQGITGWVAMHGKPMLVRDVTQAPRCIRLDAKARSELAVPMENQGAIIGVVNVNSRQVAAFDEDSLALLTRLTAEATRVISRIWLVNLLKVKSGQLSSLIAMSSKLVSKLELGALLQNITREALKMMRCRLCALFLYHASTRTIELKALAGGSGQADYKESLKIEESAVGTAINRMKQIEVHDLRKSEEHHFVPLSQKEGLVSLLASPIIYESKVIGVLNAYTDKPHRFPDEEKRIFATMASLSAVAIQNARLYSRVFASEETMRHNERLTTLGLLASEIAHEIRNPLTVIKLLFESLDLRFDPQDMRRKDAEIIAEKLDQLESIVTRVLSFGKSSESLHSRWMLDHIVRDTLILVRLKLSQSRVELDYKPPESPCIIEGSKAQLQQVLLNLIINATNAMPGGGRIAIAAGREKRDGDPFATLEITDTGTGIADELREHIFDSFLSGRAEGVGLGLAIVKRILLSHRGDIQLLHSSPQGTTMKLWLPLLSAD